MNRIDLSNINRRDFLKLSGYGLGGLVLAALGLYKWIPDRTKTAAFARPIAKDIELEYVDTETAWNKMYELAQRNNMSVGMDETLPHRPRIEKAMIETRVIVENIIGNKGKLKEFKPPLMDSFQGRAKLFFSQNQEQYISKAREKTGNINISRDTAYKYFFLEEYLPKIISIASNHGISLDALVMWLQVAEDVSGTRGGVKWQNEEIRQSQMQIFFSYLEMVGMSEKSTLLTDGISRLDFQQNIEQSIYDAPRLSKVTLGWSDLEPSLFARGYIYLNSDIRANLESKYPILVKAIEEEVKSRHRLSNLRTQLKYACDLYSLEENTLLDQLLHDKDHQGWEELGYDRRGFHGVGGYLWQMANFTEAWAKVVENIAKKNLELQSEHKKLSDRTVRTTIDQSFKEVKEDKLKKYKKEKVKAKSDFMRDQIGNNLFFDWLKNNESNPRVGELLSLWDEFVVLTKEYKENEHKLISELGKREYDFDLQLSLNIGVMKERLDYLKHSDSILTDKIKDPLRSGFSEWQAFLLMSIREIASLNLLTDESDEWWGRFTLIDEPYDPYKTLLYLGQFIEKVNYYFAPTPGELMSGLWRTIDVALYAQHKALKHGTDIRFEKRINHRSKTALNDEYFRKLSRILGITLPVNSSLMRAIDVVDRLYTGDRLIFTATNFLPKP